MHATTWTSLENTVLSEGSQLQRLHVYESIYT